MNIYNKNKKHWSQVQMMGCLHMRMLKNVSLHVMVISITLTVRFFRNFGASISQFVLLRR